MLNLNFNPFPKIETKRLVLRRITKEDANDFFELRTNVEAMQYIGKPIPRTIDDIYELVEKIESGIKSNEAIGWGISIKNSPKLIGSIGYHYIELPHSRAEIGYMILPQFWNQGLVTEAIQHIVEFGFSSMKLHSIEARISPENGASKSVLLKNNFHKEGLLKESYFFDNKFLDTEIYSLLKS